MTFENFWKFNNRAKIDGYVSNVIIMILVAHILYKLLYAGLS